MKVYTDNSIFISQKFGGISRLFKDYLENGVIKEKILLPFNSDYFSSGELFFNKSINKIRNPQLSFSEFYTQSLLSDLNCDLFHPSYYNDYFLKDITSPFVVTAFDMIHELFPEQFNFDQTTLLKKELFNKSKRIIAISNSTKHDLIRIMGIPDSKIDVVPLYTNLKGLNASDPPDWILKNKYILFTGNRGGYKNFARFFHSLIPVFSIYKDLYLVCTGHPFTPIEKAFFKEYKLENRIYHKFCSNDSELKGYYENALLFAFPSLYEGFGFPLLEAFASSCPVLCSEKGSMPEVAGDAAIYFNPYEINDMTEKILFLIDKKEIRDQLVINGNSVLKSYSMKKTMDLTLASYHMALK